MANSLNMDLKEGQKVVIKEGTLRPEFDTLEWQTVELVGNMFGMSSYTTGTAILVKFKDGEIVKMSGYDIERLVEP